MMRSILKKKIIYLSLHIYSDIFLEGQMQFWSQKNSFDVLNGFAGLKEGLVGCVFWEFVFVFFLFLVFLFFTITVSTILCSAKSYCYHFL